MWKILGNSLVAVGTAWVSISSMALGCLGALLWISTFIGLIIDGGIFWAFLWLFIGGTILGVVFTLIGTPLTLLGVGVIALGNRMKGDDWWGE